ncbi:Cation proton exchanger [Tripterygium wilfordii]|uniref:Cation proton exchanger n=1 Tax=Tripterygium wilfordii TaxID=458696 RepID=A0A7J7D4Q7_TRIWF|nr:Cation proton exchanger [Tripterygium wilfordii]
MASPQLEDGNSFSYGNYTIYNFKGGGSFTVCYTDIDVSQDKVFWKNINPLVTSLPYFITQITVMMILNHFFTLILKPLHQPRFVCQMLSGIAAGPNGLALFPAISELVTPFKSNMMMETMGNFGLVLYVFLAGLEMDISTIKGIQKKVMSIAIAGILPPMLIGFLLYLLFKDHQDEKFISGGLIWGISLSVTSFPDLARVLSDLKILHTDMGRMALSAGLVNDLFPWTLLVIVVTVVNMGERYYFAPLTLIFLIFCWYGLRPAISWLIRHTSKDGQFTDLHFYFILSGVMVCALITDAIGSQSLIGALMFGLIMPNGELGLKLRDKFGYFVSEIMMLAFFITTGLRIDMSFLFKFNLGAMKKNLEVIFIIVLASTAKCISTSIVSFCYRMPAHDAMALGLLISTKGVLSLIIINAGRNLQCLDNKEFTAMAYAILLMTAMVKPIIILIYKSFMRIKQHKNRSMERSKPDSELRILACVHSIRNLSGIINLLKISNPTKKSPLSVFVAHLVELVGRASAMLIIHDTGKPVGLLGRERAESEQIISAFKDFESSYEEAVSVQPLTAVSPYSSIHEDICALAEDKQVTLVLVPFHKLPKADGVLQEENNTFRNINQNLLASASCSIGILVDRGFGPATRRESDPGTIAELQLAMIFIGGPDDREALAYALRVAGYPRMNLVVVRFVASKDVTDIRTNTLKASAAQVDDDYINEFRFRTMGSENITYVEKASDSGDETVTAMRTIFHEFDMYIVGRGEGFVSPLTSGLSEWTDCPELGPIGDTIVSSGFAQQATVLVIQQSVPAAAKSSGHGHMTWRLGNQFS